MIAKTASIPNCTDAIKIWRSNKEIKGMTTNLSGKINIIIALNYKLQEPIENPFCSYHPHPTVC